MKKASVLAALALALAGCQGSTTDTGGPEPSPRVAPVSARPPAPKLQNGVLVGKDAFGDWREDHPGTRRKFTEADLPEPYATKAANNPPNVAPRNGMIPDAPPGFKVTLLTGALKFPREAITAPNGDLFISSLMTNQIYVIRGIKPDGTAAQVGTYAAGLVNPFGLAFYPPGPNPQYLYVGDTDAVVRFPYKVGDLQASGNFEKICDLPSGLGRGGGHVTRDVCFSKDGKTMFVSVGSHTNDAENPNMSEVDRADILSFDPNGQNKSLYASGIRNAVGLAIDPESGQLWCSVNERDLLGDNLVPDYISRVSKGDFFGWPWYYIGPNWDPRHKGEHPELKDKIRVPDVLIEAHSASLCITFYEGKMFPSQYAGEAFACEHGSWDRANRTGYKVITVPQKKGVPTGEYDDFLTGFVTPRGEPWGRPVGVAVAKDGSLIVTDDGSNSVWRVSYSGKS